jgi:uncharacterized RDD family membrane protein YckC
MRNDRDGWSTAFWIPHSPFGKEALARAGVSYRQSESDILKPKVPVVKIFLIAILAVASILIVIISVGVFLFSAATSIGTEQDQTEGMKVAGLCVLLASGITLGWIVYGLRGAWRVVSAVPIGLLICLGLLWMLPV